MCFANSEARGMADPRAQELAKQHAIMEDLRVKFNAVSADKSEEILTSYSAFMAAWRKFRQMTDELLRP